MDKKIILGVLALVAVSITTLLLIPANPTDTPDTLPWRISHPTPDTSRVFGITLGQTSLGETEKFFNEKTEVSLFKTTEGKMLVEAFFDELNFNGLKAKFVFTVAVPNDELDGMFKRGLRMNSTPSGKRITLTADDLERVRKTPVASVTYLPVLKLEEDIVKKRFGRPEERVRETKTGIVHWLYPQHGLDVTFGGSEKPVLQYVSVKDFNLLRTPLLAQGEIIK
ncbi:MAG: hypothetical protein EPO42_04515 [Gallionellaceae bacterium]|nr:MAG: hypothetical protein EPO42_04515 [Gallionellaceae bacterium]